MVALAIREPPPRYQSSTPVGTQGGTSNERRATSAEPRPLSEADLTTLWAGQRFPADALVTRQGVAVRVLHPGRRGRGAGPDFRGALIAAPSGSVLRGDIELHVCANDFRAHGHHADPRYDGVVLHVVFDDGGADETELSCGRRVPVVSLGAWARRRASELASWLQTPALWREPCVHAIEHLGRDGVIATLETLGDRRFAEREATLAEEVASRGAGEVLYRALLAGLSYGSDRALFETLTERLPWRTFAAASDVQAVEALLLAAAGPLYRIAVRPANHPARRLAGLARLLVRYRSLLDGAPVVPVLELPIAALIAAWSVPAAGGALIGRGRAIELLANALLPWAAAVATARGEAELAARARDRFALLPRPTAYGALAFLEKNLRSEDKALPLDARRQQGLLALYKTECTQGGCGRCVFS